MAEESVTITDNRSGKSVDVPIVNGGIDAGAWRGLLPGIWFYDEALMTTAVTTSATRRTTRTLVFQVMPRGPKLPERPARRRTKREEARSADPFSMHRNSPTPGGVLPPTGARRLGSHVASRQMAGVALGPVRGSFRSFASWHEMRSCSGGSRPS